MIISSNRDLFRTAKETAAHLRKRGLTEEAQDLEKATTISTLPGELLGEIKGLGQLCTRTHLRNIWTA